MLTDLHACYVRASLRQPWLGVATSLLLAVGAASALLPIFSLSDPESGQLIRDTRLADEAHSLLLAMQLASDSFEPKSESFQPQQTKTLDELYLYYVAGRTASDDVERSGDVLSVESLQRIAELEDRILAAANWSDVCKRIEGSTECEPFKSAIPLLREATDADAVVEARALLDDEWHFGLNASGQHEPRSSYVMRTVIRFGAPLHGFVSENDRREEQRKALTDRFLRPLELEVLRPTVEEWNELEALSLLYNNFKLYNLQFNRILSSDTLLFGWSIGCLYILMLVHLRSPFLALAGLFQILLSFPLALFVYRVALGFKLFGVLQSMSIFVILGIGADDIFILTDSVFSQPPDLSEHDFFLRAFRSSFTSMLTTTATTTFAFAMTSLIRVPTVRFFAIFTTCLLVVNFMLVCTFYFYIVILWHRHSSCFRRCRWQHDISIMHRLYRGYTVPWIKRSRRTLLVLLSCVCATLLVSSATIISKGSARSEPRNPYWPDGHELARRFYLELNAFPESESNQRLQLRLAWGLTGIDRQGTDPNDDEDLGTPIYLPGFDISASSSQEYLRTVCHLLRDNAADLQLDLPAYGLDSYCLMASFAQWCEARAVPFPVPSNELEERLLEFHGRYAAREYDVHQQMGFHLNEDGTLDLKFVQLLLNSSLSIFDATTADARVWDAFLKNLSDSAPPNVGRVILASRDFVVLDSVEKAQQAAWSSVALTTLIAFFVLMAFTLNWRTALLASLVITATVFGTIGMIAFFGWDLGVFESVCITILCGFTMDYTVHLAIAYGACESSSSRSDRAWHSLATVGPSVCASALSTLGSAAFLLLATITFLVRFGSFIITAVALALTFSTLGFVPLLATFGPEGEEGDLRWHSFRLQKGKIRLQKGKNYKATANVRQDGHQTEKSWPIVIEGPTTTVGPPDHSKTSNDKISAHGSPRMAEARHDEADCKGLPARDVKPKDGARERIRQACRCGGIGLALAVLIVCVTVVRYITEEEKPEEAAQLTDATVSMPPFSDLPQGLWAQLVPGGETICGRGKPYAFFVRPGLTDKVIVEFMGGGACWSDVTCAYLQSTFRDNVDDLRSYFAKYTNESKTSSIGGPGNSDYLYHRGLQDQQSDYAGWTHVYIPYCTGDLHWGSSVVRYADDLVVHHRGAVNAASAIDWLKQQISSPTLMLVTGCSAGAYASLLWAAQLALTYSPRGTRIIQFGDGGMGIVTKDFMHKAYRQWNTSANFPWHIAPVELQGSRSNDDLVNYTLTDMYRLATGAYPQHAFLQYSAAFDQEQAKYLQIMKSTAVPNGEASLDQKLIWSLEMRLQYNDSVLTGRENYAHYVGAGDDHCVLPYNRFWWSSVGSTLLHDWLWQIIAEAPNTSLLNRSVDCATALDMELFSLMPLPENIPQGCRTGIEL